MCDDYLVKVHKRAVDTVRQRKSRKTVTVSLTQSGNAPNILFIPASPESQTSPTLSPAVESTASTSSNSSKVNLDESFCFDDGFTRN